jgi:hypothetical protein
MHLRRSAGMHLHPLPDSGKLLVMRNQHRRCGRARLVLVLAGLLYLLGVVVDPLVHASAEQSQNVEFALTGTETDSPDQSDPVVPHADSQCLLCKVSGPLLLPDAEIVNGGKERSIRGTFAFAEAARGPPASTLALPRAPPRS